MKILLTGSASLLGRYLLKSQPRQHLQDVGSAETMPVHEIIGLKRENDSAKKDCHEIVRADVSDFIVMMELCFRKKPDVIIHCAANGDVDDVEQNPDGAARSDLIGTINMVKLAELFGCKLVTISSNAVFDGYNPPYSEDSPRNPVNVYGKIKSLADDVVQKSSIDWMIIRPILLFGWPYHGGRGNWGSKIISALSDGKEVRLVTDMITQPTYAGHLALCIWKLIKEEKWKEVYHIAPTEKMSLYEFGLQIAEVCDFDKNLIKPAKLSDFKQIAPRPKDTTFELSKMQEAGMVLKMVRHGILEMKEEV